MKKIFALILAFLFAACSNYQEEFDNNFGALEYADDVDYSSPSGGDDPLPSSSDVDNPSSSSVPTSSSEEVSSSSAKSSSSSESSSSSIVPYTPPSGPNYDTLDYNGQKYRTVKIGDQEWMAENMNAKVDGSACYRDSSKYCDMYGRLYSWDAAMKVCPEGWRLPDTTDWSILFKSVGGKATAATHLKATTSWTKNGDGNGDDAFGFSAFAAGGSDTGSDVKYAGKGIDAAFWTSEVKNSYDAWGVGMYWADSHPKIEVHPLASNRRSVRCIKGEPSSSSSVKSSSSVSSSSSDYSSSGEFTDPRSDKGGTSHIYPYVKYNGLVWMDEDLSYRTDQMEMGNSSHPLYSWKSAQKACPEGWRLPTIEEFNNSQGLEYKIGIWEKLVGYFLMTEGHKAENEGMYWTQSSKDDTVYAIQFSNNRDYGSVIGVDKKVLEENSVAATFAVRCVTESLTEESPRSSSSSVFISRETYLQDSGPYATVTIGGKKWMAQNLNYYGGKLQSSDHTMLCRDKTTEFNSCDGNGIYYDYRSAFDIASMDAVNMAEPYQAWTLPDSTQAAALLEAVGNVAGRLWSVEMNGTNESGFYALPSGYFSTSDKVNYNHEGNGETCFWLWSGNNETETAKALCFYPKHNAGHTYGIESRPKTQLFPIRLIYSSLHD
jgi:uncharacterized protein (TIGR02145 family)